LLLFLTEINRKKYAETKERDKGTEGLKEKKVDKG
jgi:hypothetical protein